MSDALVSVIMPVYNTAPWVGQAIDSVLSQTHAKLELICVDDGSTDCSLDLLRRRAKGDSRLRVIALPHGGVSLARNRALDEMRGDFFMCVDSDDMLHPEALDVLLDACHAYASDFVYIPVAQVPESATLEGCVRPVSRMSEPLRSAFDFNTVHGGQFGIGHGFFRRASVGNQRFDAGIAFGEDQLFWFRFIARGARGSYVYDPLVYYRQRTSSVCHSLERSRIRTCRGLIAEFLKTMLQGDVPDDFRVWAERRLQSKYHKYDTAPAREEDRRCYAVKAACDVRASSTSGGVFAVLAEHVLSLGGVVAGAAFATDWSVEHVLVDAPSELMRLRGSKYVRSRLTPSFWRSLDAAVRSSRPVLFSGTPCQVAAVRRRFPAADNLLTLDFICHGAPDPFFWQRRVEELSGRGPMASVCFRDKRQDWGRPPVFSVRYGDGSEYASKYGEDPYTAAYSADLMVSSACANCAFPACRSAADITCGDFWELRRDKANDGLGISCVLVNTERGRRLWREVRTRFLSAVAYPLDAVRQPNYRHPTKPHPGSESFRRALERGASFAEAYRQGADPSRNVAILNFHWENRNFGALLTAYALSRSVADLGLRPRNIAFSPQGEDRAPAPAFEVFRRARLPETRRITDRKGLKALRSTYGTFIVGSDQVWNPGLTGKFAQSYFLSFAGPGRRLIAASVSIGGRFFDRYGGRMLRHWLAVFDAVGIREAESARRLHRLSGRGEQIPDPVFWLDPKLWHALADGGRGRQTDVVTYFVAARDRECVQDFLTAVLPAERGRRIRSLTSADSPEDWLGAIRGAGLLVTQSLHAVSFALVFHTPFVCIVPEAKHRLRLRSLLGSVGLTDRMFESAEDAAREVASLRPVDWAAVDRKLAAFREKGQTFLAEALASERFRSSEATEAWRRLHRDRLKELLWKTRKLRMRKLVLSLLCTFAPRGLRKRLKRAVSKLDGRLKRNTRKIKDLRLEIESSYLRYGGSCKTSVACGLVCLKRVG